MSLSKLPKLTPEQKILFQKDQGLHECQVTFEDEDIQKVLNDCEKNPGHKEFIPITDFTQEHLAPYCSNNLIFNIIQNEAALTVCIKVNYVSEARPENYPWSNFKGQNATRNGTGWVRWAKDKFTEKDNKPCPCYECRHSSFPKKEWGHIHIRTAHHLVFDDSEAERTECILFYDKSGDSGQVLQGVAINLSILSDDSSELSCITHDLSLWDKLDKLDHHRDDLFEKAKREYLNNKVDNTSQLAVIISHPHGVSKQVSLGKWVHKEKVGQYDYTRYTYTTCTCPGSSGAPVYILPTDKWLTMTSHPHCKRTEKNGLNESGTGWD